MKKNQKPNIKYRTEDVFGEGYRDPVAVMTHETFALQNTDIPKTLSETILKGTEIGTKLDIMVEEIHNGCQSEDDVDGSVYYYVENAYYDEKIGIPFYSQVLKEICKIVGKPVKYCLWLADKDAVTDYYGQGIDELTIDGYDTTESVCVLSDCGYDGKLYGFTEKPECISTETVKNELSNKSEEIPSTSKYESIFKVGQEYLQVGFFGGTTVYIVKEIDRKNNQILLAEKWYDVDGNGTRPAKWHRLEKEDGKEKFLEWTSKDFGDIWVYVSTTKDKTEKTNTKVNGLYVSEWDDSMEKINSPTLI